MGANADFDGDLNDMYLRQQPGSRSILTSQAGEKDLAHPGNPSRDAVGVCSGNGTKHDSWAWTTTFAGSCYR